jgi:hypothetical protein
MFNRKLKERIEDLELELSQVKQNLFQWNIMFKQLAHYDWFEINSGGGIIAYEKNEPENQYMNFGTGITVPYDDCRLRIVYDRK